MRATAYIGHFSNGRFYSSGKAVQLPEQQRVVITLLDEASTAETDKLAAWKEAKRMIEASAHENRLLTDEAFKRDTSSRELISFADEVNAP